MRKTLGGYCTNRICMLLTADCLDTFFFFGKLIDCLVISLEAIGVFAVLAKEPKMMDGHLTIGSIVC